jgi:hypothetical protein
VREALFARRVLPAPPLWTALLRFAPFVFLPSALVARDERVRLCPAACLAGGLLLVAILRSPVTADKVG